MISFSDFSVKAHMQQACEAKRAATKKEPKAVVAGKESAQAATK